MPTSNDKNDYYFFQLKRGGTAELRLTDIAPGHNYNLTLRDDKACSQPSWHSGEVENRNEHINQVNLPAGLYYIQVHNQGSTGSTKSYRLHVTYSDMGIQAKGCSP